MLFIILLLSGGIMATTFIGARQAVRTLSALLISQTIDKTNERLQSFFNAPIRELLLAQSWGNTGMLDVDNQDALRQLFEPLMRQHPQISSLLVADGRGHEFMLLHTGDKWQSRQTRRDEWKGRTRWLKWSDRQPEPTESWEELEYDPRIRPWYKGAVKKRREVDTSPPSFTQRQLLHWTEPYIFFTTKEPGITASITFDSGKGFEQVVGFDMLLSDISLFTISLHVTEHGGVMVLTDDGRVIGLPSDPRYEDAEVRKAALLKYPEELEWTLTLDAGRAFRSQTTHQQRGPLRFLSGDQAWWGELRPFRLSTERTFWISVVVPESDLLGSIMQIRKWILLITLGVMVLAISLVLVLARRYSSPIEALVQQSDRISRGDLEEGAPIESRCTEVHSLAEAHDRMRAGLKTLLKLERDLQLAKQIQQKTFPKELPELGEYEIEAWNEPADETGGDTYDIIECRETAQGGSASHSDRIVLLLADATGHGIGPALSATEVRSMLRMAVRMGGTLPKLVHHMNEQLHADLHAGRFITAWLGELDGGSHTLTSFSAGQAPLLHYDGRRGAFNILDADTLPFGVVADLNVTLSDPIMMNPGDIFAVISDGIYEAANEGGEQFGVGRIREVISACSHASSTDIISTLKRAVAEFTGGTEAADDRTALIIKRKGSTHESQSVNR